jgi:DNA primase
VNLAQLKDEVKNRVDIVKLIGETVELKRMGSLYVGICPFPHGYKSGRPVYDSKPSLTVYPEQQTYYCYGCGAGDGVSVHGGASDVIGWVQNLHGVDFKTALYFLADYAGISCSPLEPTDKEDVIARLQDVTRRDLGYRQNLLSSKEALGYLTSRGIDEELIHYGRLGLVLNTGSSLLDGRLSFGIASISYPEYTAGMAYRSLDGSLPKYINDRLNPSFNRRSSLYLFAQNLPDIKALRRVVIVEGYFDALVLYKSGVKNVCSSLGTMVTQEQVSIISRYAKEVVIWFDGDYAGTQAALRAIPLFLKAGVKPYVINIPGLDPDTFALSYQDDVTQFIESEKQYALDWVVQLAAKEYAAVVEEKLRIMRMLNPVLQSIQDPVEFSVYDRKIRTVLETA